MKRPSKWQTKEVEAAVDKHDWARVLVCKQSSGSYYVFVEKDCYSTLSAAKKAANSILTEYEKEGGIKPHHGGSIYSNQQTNHLYEESLRTFSEQQRSSVLFRPKLMVDGTKYMVLYGDDLMSGCAGFGDTPNAAMRDFDKQWFEQKLPRSR